jgi:hypothetical protein
MEREMRARSTDRYVEITAADKNDESFDRVWNRCGLVFLGLVALIIVVSLIARATGVLPLGETAPAAGTQAETRLPVDHVRGWNPDAAPKEQSHDQSRSLVYPWRRS